VLDEIEVCREPLRSAIFRAYEDLQPSILEVTKDALELANFYVDSGILPAKKREDALHVALATTEELDVLLSWNHRHMVNVRKTEQYTGANLARGYWKTPLILTPLEAFDD
jgi:hypothetical protein